MQGLRTPPTAATPEQHTRASSVCHIHPLTSSRACSSSRSFLRPTPCQTTPSLLPPALPLSHPHLPPTMAGNMVTRLAAAAALLVAAAAAVTGGDASRYHNRGAKCEGTRKYEVTLSLNWSSRTHPRSYPAGGNFSPPTVAAHASRYQMWAPGAFARTGIQTVAETGNPAPLREELAAYEKAGHVSSWTGTDAPTPSGVETVKLTVTADAATGAVYVSGATMLFPSPDWFTGFYAVPVCRHGRWVHKAGGRLTFWDAGTDSGRTHTGKDVVTKPATTIFSLNNRGFPAFATPVGYYTIRAL
ncbi:hypothetical protein I4F81_007496 [Pyropia yezoensis]|nr:hypothetical protein I4F81_007496 [Neopyropia yezoensis]